MLAELGEIKHNSIMAFQNENKEGVTILNGQRVCLDFNLIKVNYIKICYIYSNFAKPLKNWQSLKNLIKLMLVLFVDIS